MKLVVDTNIVFSAIISPKGIISDLLLNSYDRIEFFAPSYLEDELENHQSKLIEISGYTHAELKFQKRSILKRISLISVESVQSENMKRAFELTHTIDHFDTPFIALAIELKSPLWTGDKKLIKGLKEIGVDWLLSTKEVKQILE